MCVAWSQSLLVTVDPLSLHFSEGNTVKVLTFGGNAWLHPRGYSIKKFFPPNSVENYDRPWPTGFSLAWCKHVAAQIDTPVTLIGFSAGASAALLIAGMTPMVRSCFAHSPRDRNNAVRGMCEYHLLKTQGDSTRGQEQIYSVAAKLRRGGATVHLQDTLPFAPFTNATWLERTTLTNQNHQFHNCLPILKRHPDTAGLWQ